MNDNYFTYMKRAFQLALQGEATVSPNPMVGALIVKNNKVIGEGFHYKKGSAHAEVEAINSSSENVEGATLVCNLEPCCHENKTTPPCTNLIIEKRIKKVIFSNYDPNPFVSGNGAKILKEAGIEVQAEVLAKEGEKINKVFFKNMKDKMPYVHLKSAITLDGKICSDTGDSKWISSEEARNEVHQFRKAYDAIMIGKNTLKEDNPLLSAREGNLIVKEPKKIIVGNLNDNDCSIKTVENINNVINIYTKDSSFKGLKIHHTDWNSTLKRLYEIGVCSILVEGGAFLISSLIEEDTYDQATFYISQKLLGNGKSFYESRKSTRICEAVKLNGSWKLNASGEAILEVQR